MKKIKLSVAALTIAMSMNAQDTIKTFTAPDTVLISKFQVIEMINTIDDILFWNSNDEEECVLYVYQTWENEVDKRNPQEELLANAIWGCTKLDKELGLLKGNEDNLD